MLLEFSFFKLGIFPCSFYGKWAKMIGNTTIFGITLVYILSLVLSHMYLACYCAVHHPSLPPWKSAPICLWGVGKYLQVVFGIDAFKRSSKNVPWCQSFHICSQVDNFILIICTLRILRCFIDEIPEDDGRNSRKTKSYYSSMYGTLGIKPEEGKLGCCKIPGFQPPRKHVLYRMRIVVVTPRR